MRQLLRPFWAHLSLWKGIWNVSRIRGLALTFPKWREKVKSDEKWQINVALKISWRERARADDDYKDFQEDLLELMTISLEISFFKKCGVPPTCAPQFLKNSSWAQGLGKKPFFGRVKPPKILPTFFLRPPDTYKKYILQKKWIKTAIPALSSGQSNLHTPIWGPSRQLDDQDRNPNLNNRDHLVGQLTRPYNTFDKSAL